MLKLRNTFVAALLIAVVAPVSLAQANIVKREGLAMGITRQMGITAEAAFSSADIKAIFTANNDFRAIVRDKRFPEFQQGLQKYTYPKLKKWANKRIYKHLAKTLSLPDLRDIDLFLHRPHGEVIMKQFGQWISSQPDAPINLAASMKSFTPAEQQDVRMFLASEPGRAFYKEIINAYNGLHSDRRTEINTILGKNLKHVMYLMIQKYGDDSEKDAVIF